MGTRALVLPLAMLVLGCAEEAEDASLPTSLKTTQASFSPQGLAGATSFAADAFTYETSSLTDQGLVFGGVRFEFNETVASASIMTVSDLASAGQDITAANIVLEEFTAGRGGEASVAAESLVIRDVKWSGEGGFGAMKFGSAIINAMTADFGARSIAHSLRAKKISLGQFDGAALTGATAEAIEILPSDGRGAAIPLHMLVFGPVTRISIEEAWWAGGALPGLKPRAAGPVGNLTLLGETRYIGDAVVSRTRRYTIKEIAFDDTTPIAFDADAGGVTLDLTAMLDDTEAAARSELLSKGHDAINGSGTLRYRLNAQEDRLQVTGSADAEGFSSASFDALLAGIANGLADATVETARLDIEGENLIDAAFTIAAAGTGQSPRMLRRQTVGAVTLGALRGEAISPRIPGYAAAMTAFLMNGGTLTISVAPPEPVSLAEALEGRGAMATLANDLDLKITRSN